MCNHLLMSAPQYTCGFTSQYQDWLYHVLAEVSIMPVYKIIKVVAMLRVTRFIITVSGMRVKNVWIMYKDILFNYYDNCLFRIEIQFILTYSCKWVFANGSFDIPFLSMRRGDEINLSHYICCVKCSKVESVLIYWKSQQFDWFIYSMFSTYAFVKNQYILFANSIST